MQISTSVTETAFNSVSYSCLTVYRKTNVVQPVVHGDCVKWHKI